MNSHFYSLINNTIALAYLFMAYAVVWYSVRNHKVKKLTFTDELKYKDARHQPLFIFIAGSATLGVCFAFRRGLQHPSLYESFWSQASVSMILLLAGFFVLAMIALIHSREINLLEDSLNQQQQDHLRIHYLLTAKPSIRYCAYSEGALIIALSVLAIINVSA